MQVHRCRNCVLIRLCGEHFEVELVSSHAAGELDGGGNLGPAIEVDASSREVVDGLRCGTNDGRGRRKSGDGDLEAWEFHRSNLSCTQRDAVGVERCRAPIGHAVPTV